MLIIQTELVDFTRLRFAPSGQYLLIGDGGSNAGDAYEVWHLPPKKKPAHRTARVILRGMEWHPNKDELYVPNNILELKVVSPSGKQQARLTNPGWVQGITFNVEGDWMVTHSPVQLAGWYRKEKQWRSKWIVQVSSKDATKTKPKDSYQTVALFPDGKRLLAFVSRQHFTSGRYTWTAHFQERNLTTGEVLAERALAKDEGPQGGQSRLTITPDGSAFMTFYARSMYIWPTDPTKPFRRVTVAKKDVQDFALHPSGQWLVTVCNHPEVTVWDTSTWKAVRRYDWEIGRIQSIDISPDGCLVAAGNAADVVVDGHSNKVAVWDWDL